MVALVMGMVPDLTGGGVVQKHVLDVVVNHKYLVHTDATSVACVVAVKAAFPRVDLFGEQMFEQGSLCFSGLNLCFAFRTNPSEESLSKGTEERICDEAVVEA